MRIGADKIPNDLIAMTLEKWKNNTGNQHLRPTDYILKVIGLEDYLYGEYQLRNFKVRLLVEILVCIKKTFMLANKNCKILFCLRNVDAGNDNCKI